MLQIKYIYRFKINQSSFNHLSDWIDDVGKLTTDEPIKVIIGNKCDIDNKVVNESDKNVKLLI